MFVVLLPMQAAITAYRGDEVNGKYSEIKENGHKKHRSQTVRRVCGAVTHAVGGGMQATLAQNFDLTKLQNSHEKCLIRYSQKFLYWSNISNVLS